MLFSNHLALSVEHKRRNMNNIMFQTGQEQNMRVCKSFSITTSLNELLRAFTFYLLVYLLKEWNF